MDRNSPKTPMYPDGTASRLLDTDLITLATRDVMVSRVAAHGQPDEFNPTFFTDDEVKTLSAVSARLIPQADRTHPIDLTSGIDQRLASGKTNGWRYDDMPPDGEAFRRALRGLQETARAMSNDDPNVRFEMLSGAEQDAVLAAVQRGDAAGAVWEALPSARFFEELLTELATAYYCHPLAQDEIGYTGYADAHGWQRLGLNRLESFEPRPMDASRADQSRVKHE